VPRTIKRRGSHPRGRKGAPSANSSIPRFQEKFRRELYGGLRIVSRRRSRRRRCGFASSRRLSSWLFQRTRVLALCIPVTGCDCARSKRRPVSNPQAGDSLWKRASPSRGGPLVEGTSGAADRGLLRGRTREATLLAGPAQAGLVGERVAECSLRGIPAVRATPACITTSSRHEVSGSIGLG
jgi:hypothetical protein